MTQISLRFTVAALATAAMFYALKASEVPGLRKEVLRLQEQVNHFSDLFALEVLRHIPPQAPYGSKAREVAKRIAREAQQ